MLFSLLPEGVKKRFLHKCQLADSDGEMPSIVRCFPAPEIIKYGGGKSVSKNC